MKELIVIIDPQKDFTHEAGNYAKRHTGITQLKDVKKRLDNLLATNNETKIILVVSNYEEEQFEKNLSICIPGTMGHEVDITIDDTIPIFIKSQHSCFSSDAFHLYLKNNAIEQLILCGFLAEYCVRQTALDGLDRGMRITLLQDCIGTGDDVQDRKEQMLVELKAKGAQLINSCDLFLGNNNF